jgi:hypothetical protein
LHFSDRLQYDHTVNGAHDDSKLDKDFVINVMRAKFLFRLNFSPDSIVYQQERDIGTEKNGTEMLICSISLSIMVDIKYCNDPKLSVNFS